MLAASVRTTGVPSAIDSEASRTTFTPARNGVPLRTTAAIVCVPAPSATTVMLAAPEINPAEPIDVAPSENRTVPAPPPANCAVKVTGCPNTVVCALPVSVRVAAAALTACVKLADAPA